jgi:acetyl esterase/lipase
MRTAPLHLVLLLCTALSALAGDCVIPLWERGAPGFEQRKDEPEQAKDWWVKNIHNPSLTVFQPAQGKANGCALIVAPGGGLRELVFNAEGRQVADFLTPLGVTVFVLKYRLPGEPGSPYNTGHVRQDALRAVRMVRSRAAEFGIDPKRIGMLGFSAGGYVMMMIAFDKDEGDAAAPDPVDRANGRPDFLAYVYPGGQVPATIPSDTPPSFLLCANDDEYGCDAVTLDLAMKLRAAKVPMELHMLAEGKHAFNMGDRSPLAAVHTWPQRLADWMGDRGYLKRR